MFFNTGTAQKHESHSPFLRYGVQPTSNTGIPPIGRDSGRPRWQSDSYIRHRRAVLRPTQAFCLRLSRECKDSSGYVGQESASVPFLLSVPILKEYHPPFYREARPSKNICSPDAQAVDSTWIVQVRQTRPKPEYDLSYVLTPVSEDVAGPEIRE